jgi:hypothetical protein
LFEMLLPRCAVAFEIILLQAVGRRFQPDPASPRCHSQIVSADVIETCGC